MEKLRNLEMLRFENWLWEHYSPADIFDVWTEKATEAIFALAVAADLDPSEIILPLSEEGIYKPLCTLHDFLRTPLEERPEKECCREVYPGVALTHEELRWVAIHIQNALIPAI